MKKTIILIIVFALFAASSVSSFGKKEGKPAESAENNSGTVSESGSNPQSGVQQTPGSPNQLKDASQGEIEITGLVEWGFKNRISVVVNPKSKSRVSYYPDEKSAGKLEKMLGKTVTVTGKIKSSDNPFKKEIEISEIKK